MDARIIEAGDADEASDMAKAQMIGDVLNEFYPNHPWLISFQGRAIIVRHMGIAFAVHMAIGREGFGAVLPADKLGTPKQVRHSAMQFGGQLLEAFGMPRGAWDGRPPVVPAAWQYKKQSGFH